MFHRVFFALVPAAAALALLIVFACQSSDKKTVDDEDKPLPSGSGCDTVKPPAPAQDSDCPTPDHVPLPGSGVTWADEVIAFSSEWCDKPGQNSAQDATGAPDCLNSNLLPQYGDQGCAWASREISNNVTIELGFPEQPYPPSRMYVYEVAGIDGLQRADITFTDGTTVAYTHYAHPEDPCFKLITFDFDNPGLMVESILLTLDQELVGYWTEIDAVGLI